MFAACVCVGATWLATVLMMSWEPSRYGVSIADGRAKFRDHCGACHIVEKGISTHHGPNLYGFGKVAHTRRPGMSSAEYVLESILEPEAFVAPQNRHGMPRSLASSMSVEELRNIVAFVVSRGAKPDYREIRALEVPAQPATQPMRVIRRDDMELAERLLRGRAGCVQCHSLYRNAEHTVYAPPLFGVGLSDETLLRESIVEPNKVVAPHHRWMNVVLNDGTIKSGKLVGQSRDRIVLVTRGEENQLVQVEIPRDQIEEDQGEPLVQVATMSPMPAGLKELLSEEELDAIVALIRQLN